MENSTNNQKVKPKKLLILLVILTVIVVSFVIFLNQNNNKGIVSDPYFTSYRNKLAPSFPDFPVFPGAKIEESRKENGAIDRKKGFSALWKVDTGKNAIEISEWYKTELMKTDWTIEETPTKYPVEIILKAKRKDTYAIIIIEKEGPDETEILVHLPAEKL